MITSHSSVGRRDTVIHVVSDEVVRTYPKARFVEVRRKLQEASGVFAQGDTP